MDAQAKRHCILYVEDDEDDRLLAKEAIEESSHDVDLRFVENGVEALAYIRGAEPYDSPEAAPRPDIILLDFNMPVVNGREVLRVLKTDIQLARIPIIVLTTSSSPVDINTAYDLGVNAYIVKPSRFDDLVDVFRTICDFWLKAVQFPDIESETSWMRSDDENDDEPDQMLN